MKPAELKALQRRLEQSEGLLATWLRYTKEGVLLLTRDSANRPRGISLFDRTDDFLREEEAGP